MPAADHAFSTALFHHRSGNFQQAEVYCRRVLKRDSEHAESLHLLGVLASEAGDQKAAATLIGRAIKAAGPQTDYCVNLGLVLTRQGRLEDAATCYRQALRPDPTNWKTILKLGRVLAALGRRQEAREALEIAVALSGDAESHFALANQLHIDGNLDDAVAHFRDAIRLQPGFPEAYFNMGVTLTMQNKVKDAMSAYSSALLLKPHYPEALNNYGILLQASGRFEEASAHYLQAIHYKPEYVDPHYNLGLAFQNRDLLCEALKVYNRLLQLNPQHSEAHNNRGNVLLALGDASGAAAAYGDAIAAHPEHVDAHLNLGIAQLLLGQFAEGWRGYEWRLRKKSSAAQSFSAPLWNGSDVGAARILIHAEQGFGDTVQFARYAPMVKARCGFLIFQCQPALVRTLSSVQGIDQVIASGTEAPPFDYHVPLLSLPGILGTDEDSIPASTPYISTPESLMTRWRNRIPASTDLKVGLVWAGNPGHMNDRNRSIPSEEFSPLLGIAGIRFYSLHKDSALANADCVGLEFTDFADTAAAIASLDLVISVDTSVAHLAGAMGKPIWTLLPFMADWRWMLARTDSPWYPSMRLFRQTEPKNWRSVIEEVRAQLLSLLDSRKGLALVG
jgi:tetratricopeptide (TPR) repeat protein